MQNQIRMISIRVATRCDTTNKCQPNLVRCSFPHESARKVTEKLESSWSERVFVLEKKEKEDFNTLVQTESLFQVFKTDETDVLLC